MFCLKGTVSQDFLLSGFFMNHLPPGLGKSANLWTYKICYICGPSACVAIWGFANFEPNIFCNFQICNFLTQICCGQICKLLIFLLTNSYLKCSNSNFYQIKNSAEQTSRQLLDSFCYKGREFFKKMFNSLCLMVENLQICNLLTGSLTKFAICRSNKRNLQTRISQKFADLSCKYFCAFLNKFETALMGYSGAWRELIHEKNLKLKISWHCPFKLPFACKELFKVKTAAQCPSLSTGNYIP
jgi:hypothetical protein